MLKLWMMLLLLYNCSSPPPYRNSMSAVDEYRKALAESEIYTTIHERPKLGSKINLGIFFRRPNAHLPSKQDWNWSEEDKNLITKEFSLDNRIERVFELVDTERNHDISSLRLMAAEQGADALLVVEGQSDVKSKLDYEALTYLVILPAFFIKGVEVEGEFVSQAVLWSVERPYIHFGLHSIGHWQHKRPLVFRNISKVIKKSKDEALRFLREKLHQEVKSQRI
ncbi:MAG: hypothetical protein AB7I27_14810 [Bacteriovoracaceae bacterium]